MRGCRVFNLAPDLQDYAQVWRYQKALMEHCWNVRKSNGVTEDCIILVQHKPVYTLGKGASKTNLKFAVDDPTSPLVYRVERGGEVTWHGEGQLVCYPIFDLNNHKRDLHWFANRLEQTVINVLAMYDINSHRSTVNNGVWVGSNKLCTLGVTASRWITMHGIAINVNCDLTNFDKIVPCGVTSDKGGVCRVKDLLKRDIDVNEFSERLVVSFADLFDLNTSNEIRPLQTLEEMTSSSPYANTLLTKFNE